MVHGFSCLIEQVLRKRRVVRRVHVPSNQERIGRHDPHQCQRCPCCFLCSQRHWEIATTTHHALSLPTQLGGCGVSLAPIADSGSRGEKCLELLYQHRGSVCCFKRVQLQRCRANCARGWSANPHPREGCGVGQTSLLTLEGRLHEVVGRRAGLEIQLRTSCSAFRFKRVLKRVWRVLSEHGLITVRTPLVGHRARGWGVRPLVSCTRLPRRLTTR